MAAQATGVISERWRISHSKTQRDGWGYESSVEMVFDGDVTPDILGRMQTSLAEVDGIARIERDRRRAKDEIEREAAS